MITELIENMEKYFWSKSNEGIIVIGGNSSGRFYGQIELTIDNNTAIIKTNISNGVTASINLVDRPYSILTQEYQLIKELYDKIDKYLGDQNIKQNQEINRELLMQNVFNLLPKYSEVV